MATPFSTPLERGLQTIEVASHHGKAHTMGGQTEGQIARIRKDLPPPPPRLSMKNDNAQTNDVLKLVLLRLETVLARLDNIEEKQTVIDQRTVRLETALGHLAETPRTQAEVPQDVPVETYRRKSAVTTSSAPSLSSNTSSTAATTNKTRNMPISRGAKLPRPMSVSRDIMQQQQAQKPSVRLPSTQAQQRAIVEFDNDLLAYPLHLKHREPAAKQYKIWTATWNMAASNPMKAMSQPEAEKYISQLVPPGYEIYVLGIQECIFEDKDPFWDVISKLSQCERVNLNGHYHSNDTKGGSGGGNGNGGGGGKERRDMNHKQKHLSGGVGRMNKTKSEKAAPSHDTKSDGHMSHCFENGGSGSFDSASSKHHSWRRSKQKKGGSSNRNSTQYTKDFLKFLTHKGRDIAKGNDLVEDDFCDKVFGRGDGSLMHPKYTGIAIWISPRLKKIAEIISVGKHSFGRDKGSKGGCGVVITVGATSIAFVSCHLDSKKNSVRHAQYKELVDQLGNKLGNKYFQLTEQFHHIVWMGDLNFRCKQVTGEKAVEMLNQSATRTLFHQCDDLVGEKRNGATFYNFLEPVMTKDFVPTYKKKELRGPIQFDDPRWAERTYRIWYKEPIYKGGKVKSRVPGWTDRIQVHSLPDRVLDLLPEMVQDPSAPTEMSHNYRPINNGLDHSDHSPVVATFTLQPRKVESKFDCTGSHFTPATTGMHENPLFAANSHANAAASNAVANMALASKFVTFRCHLTLRDIQVENGCELVKPKHVRLLFPGPFEPGHPRHKIQGKAVKTSSGHGGDIQISRNWRGYLDVFESLHLLLKVHLNNGTKGYLVLSMSELNLGLTAFQEHYGGGGEGRGDMSFKSTVIRDMFLNGLPCVVKDNADSRRRSTDRRELDKMTVKFVVEIQLHPIDSVASRALYADTGLLYADEDEGQDMEEDDDDDDEAHHVTYLDDVLDDDDHPGSGSDDDNTFLDSDVVQHQ